MNSEKEQPSLIAFERKFAFVALFVCLPIIFAKIILGNNLLLNAAGEIVGGKENVWYALLFPFNLVWRFGWFFVCLTIGILFTYLSYYIVYLDSNVPGVQPPSPLSPGMQSRFLDDQGTPQGSHMHIDKDKDDDMGTEEHTADDTLQSNTYSGITVSSMTSIWDKNLSEPKANTTTNVPLLGNYPLHKKQFQVAEQQSLGNELLMTVEHKTSLQEDYFEIFGKVIAMKLRNLPKHQMLMAEKIINDVLFEAEMGNLTLSHRLIDDTVQHLSSS